MERFPVGLLVLLLAIVLTIAGCSIFKGKKEVKPFVSEVVHPEWSKNSVIYEVNIRQFTPEGTFDAFAGHLPRLKELGVDVLWLMPINPIGIKNRKEPLGSYYSVRDYKDVNPEFGNIDDFKDLVSKAHELGFHLIIDWVPNHSSWDNNLTVEHPEWYVKDSKGSFIPPIEFDWTDVIQFDWLNMALQDYMIEALKFWVNIGVDGFRVDHPHQTPYEFWERARVELNKIKPVFMIAENEEQTDFMKNGFDMSYAWELHHLINRIAQGKDSVKSLNRYYTKEWSLFPLNVYRMVFLDNHDENSWNGTINSRMGAAQVAFAVFTFTTQGVPLLYNGQEVCLDKSLKFFERDTIKWDTCRLTGFYKDLIDLKKSNIALWNGESGGKMEMIKTNKDSKVFCFYREKEENRVIVFLNLSKKNLAVKPEMTNLEGEYKDYFSSQETVFPLTDSLRLEPWGYKVFVK
ncbi:MAG TPA: alpha-amylase family glycosyl hydrolase [Bacteroidales bacterium]|nr:alpha-amylase family glycosyl hydrolase [Bacteroidales bacterium]